MIPIETLTQYKALVSQNKQRLAKVESNCFLIPDSIRPMIDEGRLRAALHEKGLYVFAEEGSYRNLYYFWDAAEELSDLPREKTLLVEEMSSEGWKGYAARAEEKLLRSGFRLFKRNLQFELFLEERATAIEQELSSRITRLCKEGIYVIPCDTFSLAEQTVTLWRRKLDVTDIPEEHTQFLTRENAHVVCAVNNADEVIGAYWWYAEKKGVGEGRHIVTRRDYLRRGIGTTLLLYGQRDLLDRGVKRMVTWISESNENSILLHEGAGFQKNGKISIQYILEKEK